MSFNVFFKKRTKGVRPYYSVTGSEKGSISGLVLSSEKDYSNTVMDLFCILPTHKLKIQVNYTMSNYLGREIWLTLQKRDSKQLHCVFVFDTVPARYATFITPSDLSRWPLLTHFQKVLLHLCTSVKPKMIH